LIFFFNDFFSNTSPRLPFLSNSDPRAESTVRIQEIKASILMGTYSDTCGGLTTGLSESFF